MARLPVPGSDDGTWGDVLNDFLDQAHSSDGALKANSVSSDAIQDSAVTDAKVASGISQSKVQNLTTDLAEKYVKPGTGIPKTELTSAVQASLDAADTADTNADSKVSTHASASDPHSTASYAIMLGGGRRIFVQSTDPSSSAQDGDIWIDTT